MSLGVDEIEGILSAHGRMPTGASFQDGEMFGNWRVTAFLGKGGNGEVYRAVHVSLGTAAALKVLVRNEPRARERFVREARLLSELKSASFPQFFEYGEANGFFYLVMELLEPGDLPTGDREIARFLRQVCDAVTELHARGIVHRDIKPSNILWRAPHRYGGRPATAVCGSRRPWPCQGHRDIGQRISDIGYYPWRRRHARLRRAGADGARRGVCRVRHPCSRRIG